jgi:glycosyltransferase involved in cell wall biosynthesis
LNPDNAVFAPPEDLEAWTTALTDLIRKTDHRHQLAQQARQDVQHYTWKTRERTILDGFIKGKGKP